MGGGEGWNLPIRVVRVEMTWGGSFPPLLLPRHVSEQKRKEKKNAGTPLCPLPCSSIPPLLVIVIVIVVVLGHWGHVGVEWEGVDVVVEWLKARVVPAHEP